MSVSDTWRSQVPLARRHGIVPTLET